MQFGDRSKAGPASYSTWISGNEAPLLAHVSVPDGGRARGVVVLCPPSGKEHIDTYRGIALAAQMLAARGVVAVRFDYPGVGDSAVDQTAPGLTEDWIRSVARVIEFAERLEVGAPAVAGLRIGALLAATAIARSGGSCEVAGLALWDPVTSGSEYVRRQQLIYRLATNTGRSKGDIVHLVGADMSVDARSTLETLTLADLDAAALAAPVLLAVRDTHRDDPKYAELARRLSADVVEVVGQEAFVEPVGYVGITTDEQLRPVVDWLAGRMPDDTRPVAERVEPVVEFDGVRETIERLGPDRLFAIRTESVEGRPGGRVIIFHGTSNEHRIGPARLWVEAARDVARAGHVAIRFDRRGTGESGIVISDERTELYDEASRVDSIRMISSAGVPFDRVLTAGVCSGAWNAAYASAKLGALGVVIVNNMVWTMRPAKLTRQRIDKLNDPPKVGDRKSEWGIRARAAIRSAMPYRCWLWLGRSGGAQVPEVLLGALHRRGVAARVVLSKSDSEWFYRQRGSRSLDRLRRRAWNEVLTFSEGGDHAAFEADFRRLVRQEVLAAVGTSESDEVVMQGGSR